MKYLRNSEMRTTLLLFSFISACATVSAFLLNFGFGMFTLLLCLLFVSVYIIFQVKQYKKIADLSFSIDKMLHGNFDIDFHNYSEGELAVLQSEINKMVIRLKEQHDCLQRDKIYLSDSIADISHQVRTPLTSIGLLVSFISEPNISVARRKELTYQLYELLSRIDWLITALLKISKLDAGTVNFKKENISLESLINKAVAPLLIVTELKGQTFNLSASGDFSGDISWTCEAITNIIKNCIEHTPNNGSIDIQACENALFSEIIISDSGSGIDSEDMPHIFKRFYKGKNSNDKSFGIGLALARMIIVGQDGTVKAENLKQGTRFIVRFYKGAV